MVKLFFILLLLYIFLIYSHSRKGIEKFKGYRYCHRGYFDNNQLPENSIGAFKKAVECGYGFEFDVHLLADGNLAVIHDSNIKRMTSKDLIIEDLTTEDIKDIHLLNTDYTIPTFKEVLEIVNGKVPLIIEIKYHCKNVQSICDEVMNQLEGYKGDYCVECFYPEVVEYFKKHYPEVIRGQLTFNYFSQKNHPFPISFALQYLLLNVTCRPDFIAYEVSARKNLSNQILTKIFKVQEVSWTIKSKESLLTVEKDGALAIFEGFDPKN